MLYCGMCRTHGAAADHGDQEFCQHAVHPEDTQLRGNPAGATAASEPPSGGPRGRHTTEAAAPTQGFQARRRDTASTAATGQYTVDQHPSRHTTPQTPGQATGGAKSVTNRATGRLPVPRQRPQQDMRPTKPQQAGYRGRALPCVVGLDCTVYSVYILYSHES